MTHKELKRFRYLERHLPVLKAEMEEAEDRLEACRPAGADQEISDPGEYMRTKLDLFQKESRYRAARSDLERMERFVAMIPDDLTRSIFELHYQKGWTWQRIAAQFGWSDESWPRKQAKKYFQESEKSDFDTLQ